MSCTQCFRQADNSIVKYEVGPKWTLGDGSIVTTEPALMIYTNEVDCSLFATSHTSVEFFEVEDADGNQIDGALVELRKLQDGTFVYVDVATGTQYATQGDYLTAVGGTALVNNEDTDYGETVVEGCDGGVSIRRISVYRDEDPNDIVGTRIETAAGVLHTLSGSETWGGYCNTISETAEYASCYGLVADVTGGTAGGDWGALDAGKPLVHGYRKISTDYAGVRTVVDYNEAGTDITATHVRVKCC